MEVTKTLKIKVHSETDKVKLSYLDKITARMTYTVNEYLNIIGASYAVVDLKELESYNPFFKSWTKLSTGYLQQCRDKAIWMWNSYIALLDKWEQSVARVKKKYAKDKKKLDYIQMKLEKRKPSPPTESKKYNSKKIPVFLDTRTCNLIVNLKSKKGLNLKLSKYWLKLSTLKKRHTVLIPLHVTEYHESRLKDAEVKSIQLVNLDCGYQGNADLNGAINIGTDYAVKNKVNKPKAYQSNFNSYP